MYIYSKVFKIDDHRYIMGYLILVRHGESKWNLANKFTGWVDVPLSEVGIHEAMISAKKLEGLRLDIAFTSELERAQETLLLIMAKQDYTGIFMHKGERFLHPGKLEKHELPVFTSSKINERYYGKLQGMDKDKARKKYGHDKVFIWRRSWDVRPPGGESLKDTYNRTIPYFKKEIVPHLKKKNVIVCAHGNSLRSIIKYLDGISNEDIPHLELPTGKPIIYKYARGKLVKEKDHSFTRKVYWDKPKEYKKKYSKFRG
jgi:2,3-bisphosphoglycerate-dependent phosphoglycerate mutase